MVAFSKTCYSGQTIGLAETKQIKETETRQKCFVEAVCFQHKY